MTEQQPRAALTLATLFRYDATGGVLAITAMLVAVLMANTSLGALYHWLHDFSLPLANETVGGSKTFAALVTDLGLFLLFLVYGMRLKLDDGDQDRPRGIARFATPALVALGALLISAILLYATLGIIGGDAAGRAGVLNPKTGWIAMGGTDLAVIMAVLMLAGTAATDQFRRFSAETAIFAGISAIGLIAVVYANLLSGPSVAGLSIGVIALLAMRIGGLANGWPYLAVGALLWLVLQGTGVHGALAGVLAGGFMPPAACSALTRRLLPAASWVFVPLIAFFNSGIDFSAMTETATPALPLALPIAMSLYVAASLFVGKQIGALVMTRFVLWLGQTNSGFGHDVFGSSGRHIYAASLLAGASFGIGLAFSSMAGLAPEMIGSIRLGILMGSIASAGMALLVLAGQKSQMSAQAEKIVLFTAGPIAGASLAILVTYTDFSGLSNSANNFIELLLFLVFVATALVAVNALRTSAHVPEAPRSPDYSDEDVAPQPPAGVVGPDTDLSTLDVEDLRGLI